MKVLVTGASGVFGRAAIDRLVMEGHEVAAISRGRPRHLPSIVEWTSVDIRDLEGVTKAMVGCDVVVHNAWALTQLETPEATRAVDIGGTSNVLTAMQVTGCRRLVHASSVMAYGANPDNPPALREDDELRPSPAHLYSLHKREAEQLIAASGVEAVLVRAANAVGRHVGNVTAQGFGGPVIPTIRGHESRMQYIHPEDIGRFFAQACVSDLTGPVNLAADGTVTLAEVARALGRRTIELPAGVLKRTAELAFSRGLTDLDPGSFDAMMWFPTVDTSRLKQEWGFRCAYTSEEAVVDFGRSTYWFTYLGNRRFDVPWRIKYPEQHLPDNIPPSDGTELQPAAAPEHAGEFDSLVDPRYAHFTAANVSEAFAGPMTPLSIEYAGKALRCSAEVMAHTLGVPDDLYEPLSNRPIAVFGHGLYANLSVIHRMARNMPGYDRESWNQALFGGSEVDAGLEVEHEPEGSAADRRRRSLRMGPRFARFGTECHHVAAMARSLQVDEQVVRDLSDERLEARINLVFDALVHAWAIAGNASAFVGEIFALVEGEGEGALSRGGADDLESAGAIRGVAALAERARSEAAVRAILSTMPPGEALERLRADAPDFMASFEQLLRDYGHRGPRETELSSRVFADDPALLLDAIAKRMQVPPAPSTRHAAAGGARARLVSSFGHRYQRHREVARDAVVRLTHQYRIAARERARRLVEAGVLDEVGDGFFLTREQLLVPPSDARGVVARRRAERARLAAQRMPVVFHGTWSPLEDDVPPLAAGESIQGMPASAGQVTGVARIMSIDDLDALQPGEILVTELTDTGWTPLFSYAGAVVTDVGGQMSHAAVVAREFGIPCVVQAIDATRRIRTGQTIRIDGAAGTVTAVD